jgi:sec-independent protein translocase protein TatA
VPFGIGPLELVIVLLIVLLLFGARRLPELGRSLGHGMREFKDSVTGKDTGEQPPDEVRELPSGERASVASDDEARQPVGRDE